MRVDPNAGDDPNTRADSVEVTFVMPKLWRLPLAAPASRGHNGFILNGEKT